MFKFLPALAQVISRIMHPIDSVYKTLFKVITTVISEYPEQTMWSLIAVVKSSVIARAVRGQEVALRLKVRGSSTTILILG
jgi:serine/threonine-protein kinase ATR